MFFVVVKAKKHRNAETLFPLHMHLQQCYLLRPETSQQLVSCDSIASHTWNCFGVSIMSSLCQGRPASISVHTSLAVYKISLVGNLESKSLQGGSRYEMKENNICGRQHQGEGRNQGEIYYGEKNLIGKKIIGRSSYYGYK